jgi:hypothetical protein
VIITAEMLRKHSACGPQVDLFVSTFGESVELTPETWAQAFLAGLDVLWCEALLTGANHDAYEAQVKPLYDAYLAQRKTLHDAYEAQVKPFLYQALCAEVVR